MQTLDARMIEWSDREQTEERHEGRFSVMLLHAGRMRVAADDDIHVLRGRRLPQLFGVLQQKEMRPFQVKQARLGQPI